MLRFLATQRRDEAVNPFVLVNHRVRTASYILAFAIFAAYWWGKTADFLLWGGLLLQFFILPHLMYWRTQRATHPLAAELQNLWIDAFLLGWWCAVAGLPLWLTFTFFCATLVNITFYRSLIGALQSSVCFFVGVLCWAALGRLQLTPATDTLTTGLCIVGLTLYLLTITHAAYQHSINLRETRREFRDSEQALHYANVDLHAHLLENQRLQAQLKEQANRDPLTGLYNRRYLDSTLTRELAHAKRTDQPLWLMLIDIDHFKNINDNYGHQAGDEVIKALAQLLHDQARADDVVCRYGGEEFLLLLPNMPHPVALARAEQWREAFAQRLIHHAGVTIQATLSIGMADYPHHGLRPEDLIGNADRALYRAKADGRNRVVIYEVDMLESRV